MYLEVGRPDELCGSSSISARSIAGYVGGDHGADSRKQEEQADSIIITCLRFHSLAEPETHLLLTTVQQSCNLPAIEMSSVHLPS